MKLIFTLRVTLYYMLALFPLPGASCCIVYLFITLIYTITIVQLNILLLLCISIASIASASYFIHSAILFGL